MGKTSNGAKAGVVSGLTYGIIAAIFTFLWFNLFKTQVMDAFAKVISSSATLTGQGMTAQSLYNYEMILEPVLAIIEGLIIGLIMGIIFAYVYQKLPGSKITTKGLIFGIILWVILGVLLGISNLREFGTSYYSLYIVGALIGSIVYGYLLGMLFSRFERANEPTVTEPSS